MPDAKSKPSRMGRPKSANPRLIFSCRLEAGTVEQIKLQAKVRGVSAGRIVDDAFKISAIDVKRLNTQAINLSPGTVVISPVTRKPHSVAATPARAGMLRDRHAALPIKRPNGKA